MNIATLSGELAALSAKRPVDEPPIPILLPDRDEEETDDGDFIGFAEGQSFLIEYSDSAGRPSRRRITVWNIREGAGGVPLLHARCHERKADRCFRVDRIKCCIDYDGVVHDDVAAFLHETFGMALRRAVHRPDASGERWLQIKSKIAPAAVLLAAISRADHRVHAAETHAATDYLSLVVERTGVFLTDADTTAIWRHVARLRPGQAAIERAIDDIADLAPEQVKRLLIAAVQVMDADGHRHPAEIGLLNSLSEELLGVPIIHS